MITVEDLTKLDALIRKLAETVNSQTLVIELMDNGQIDIVSDCCQGSGWTALQAAVDLTSVMSKHNISHNLNLSETQIRPPKPPKTMRV